MYCSSPGSSVHSISQARILEWVAISFFRGSPRPRDQTWVSCMAGDSLPTDPCMHVSREGVLVICYECLHESCARATCLHIMHHSGTCKSMLPLVFFRSQFDVSQFSSPPVGAACLLRLLLQLTVELGVRARGNCAQERRRCFRAAEEVPGLGGGSVPSAGQCVDIDHLVLPMARRHSPPFIGPGAPRKTSEVQQMLPVFPGFHARSS